MAAERERLGPEANHSEQNDVLDPRMPHARYALRINKVEKPFEVNLPCTLSHVLLSAAVFCPAYC